MADIRAFFAVDAQTPAITSKLATLKSDLDELNCRIRYVAPENLHLTLKFLGDIDEELVPAIQTEAEKITFPEFTLKFQGVGCLPGFHYINAIYIGVIEGKEALAAVAKAIDGLSDTFGFRKEKRAFKAHLTIGRVKRVTNRAALVDVIKAHAEDYFDEMTVSEFVLKQSVLTKQGPIYTNLFTVPAQKK
jgi:2'-5' RNA ligase